MTVLSIGLRGYYTATGVFETIIKPNVIHTCETIETLRSLVESSNKPFEQIYIPAGIPRSNFDRDYSANVTIVGLRLDNGNLIKLPSYYLDKLPDANGVLYVGTMVGFAMNAMPISLDLEEITNEIKDYLISRVGVDCRVTTSAYTPELLVDYDRHKILEDLRNRQISKYSAQNRIRELETALALSQQKTTALEDYIKSLIN